MSGSCWRFLPCSVISVLDWFGWSNEKWVIWEKKKNRINYVGLWFKRTELWWNLNLKKERNTVKLPCIDQCSLQKSCHTWLWFNVTAALTLFCRQPQLDQILSCSVSSSLDVWFITHSIFEFTFQTPFIFVAVSLLGSPCVWGRAEQLLWAVFVVWSLSSAQQCGSKPGQAGFCSQSPRPGWLWVLSWCCWDEPTSPQSQMVPFVCTILAHFCSFSLPSLHESASTRTEVSTSCLFSQISILPPCWAAELRSQVCAWGWDGAVPAINPVNPPH